MSTTNNEQERREAVTGGHSFVPQDDYNIRLCAVCGLGKNDHYRYFGAALNEQGKEQA